MDVATIAGVRLCWEQAAAPARLTVERPDAVPRHPPATLHFRVDAGRVRVSLVLLEGRREIDVSIQPAVVVTAVGAGMSASEAACRRVSGWLVALADAEGTWRPAPDVATNLLATLAGGAFPLLGAAFDRGAAPVGEVPRWAAPVVACPDARSAAAHAFGPRATRPVIVALAASMVAADPGRPVALHPLGLGLMAPALAPDRLARVLRAEGPARQPEEWPDGEVVRAAQRLTPGLGEHRTERLLVDAATLDRGPTLLVDALRAYELVQHRLGRRVPTRLVEFRDHCAGLMPPDPNPDGLVAPPRRRARPRPAPVTPAAGRSVVTAPGPRPPSRAGSPVLPTGVERRRAQHRAPVTSCDSVEINAPLVHPPAVMALAGRWVPGAADRLRFVVPRTAAELSTWGSRLQNCIGSFGPAVHEGRARLLGVEVDDRLGYCIDVRPDGAIRQFLGAHNRQVPVIDRLAVVHALARAGIVDRDLAVNRPWFEPA